MVNGIIETDYPFSFKSEAQHWPFKKCLNVCSYFWLCRVFIAVHGFSLVVANRGCSLVVMHGLLITVASLVAEHGLYGMQASITTSCMGCKATGETLSGGTIFVHISQMAKQAGEVGYFCSG